MKAPKLPLAFDTRSARRIKTCHSDIQKLFYLVHQMYPCAVICGHRNEQDQNAAYKAGFSKLRFPYSKHNKKPSLAVDMFPLPLDWNELSRFYHFAGYVQAVADFLEIPIRFGGDWDGDKIFSDNRFNDLVHFEILI